MIDIKMSDIFLKWEEYKKITTKNTACSTYFNILDTHIKPFFNEYNLHNIDNDVLQDFITQKLKNGRIKNDGNLSSIYVNNIAIVLIDILEYAKKQGYSEVDYNVPTPRIVRKDIVIFTQEEQSRLVNYLTENMDNLNFCIFLSLFSGVRIGEICSLTYGSISENGELNIEKTVQRIKNLNSSTPKTVLVMTEPKSIMSIRKIPLPDFVYNQYKKINVARQNNLYIMTGTEKYAEPKTLERYYKKILSECNISYKKFHTLRHTFATNFISKCIDYKCLAEIMGHSNVQTTLNLYVHPDMEQKRYNMNKLSI